MDAEAYLLERFFGIEIFSAFIVAVEFFLAQLVEVLHDRIISGFQPAVIGAVGDAEPGIQFGEQDFNGIDLTVAEILVAAEEIF